MTTERGSQDPGSDPTAMGDDALGNIDALVGTREDEMTSTGLSDAPYSGGAGTSTADSGAMGSGSGSFGSGGSGSGDRLQEATGGVVDRVAQTTQQQVGSQVNSQLSRGADMLDQVSQAIRQSGDQMRDQQPQIASFADTAAQQVDKASEFFRQTDFQGLVREAESFARRQPAVFLGGAFALGLVASRFLKASPQDGGSMQSGQFSRGFGSGYGGSSYGSQYGGSSYGGSSYGSGYAGSDASAYGSGSGYGSSGYGSDGSQQQNYGSSSASSMGSTGGAAYAEPGSGATSDQGVEHGGV
jgi:uncharacterized protein YukE